MKMIYQFMGLQKLRPTIKFNISTFFDYGVIFFKAILLTLIIGTLLLLANPGFAQRKMENLGRGVVVTRATINRAFVSWRLLGTEPNNIGFNVYRKTGTAIPVKLNSSILTGGTNWEDITANFTLVNAYFVRAVLNGVEQPPSASFTLPANTPAQPFFNVPIENTPGYAVKFIWVGDLDGDGEYDFVFDKQPTDATKTILLEAYSRFGKLLWRYDCGPNSVNKYNIAPGSSSLDIGHGDNFTVYDINNDGKGEVIVRTANGVRFPDGTTLSNADNNKQFISVLEGTTGKELSRVPVPGDFIARGPLNGHMGIAYLDGVNPSVVLEAKNRNADKSFNELIVTYDWKNNGLVQNWKWLRPANEGNYPDGHQIRIIDMDGDGRDEIIPMGHVVKSDGKSLYSFGPKGVVHGDRFHIADMDPSHPGLEYYGIQQNNQSGLAWFYADAKTGQILSSQTLSEIRDLGRGLALDCDPRYPGYELYTFVDGLYNVNGKKISTSLPGSYPNLRFWWDGDVLSEMLDGVKFTKWNHLNSDEGRLYTAKNVNVVGPNTPGFMGDILGDWREEVVYEAADHNSLVVYTTPIPTTTRIYTLPHNPGYRNCMNVKGYYQGNMVDYYLGNGMSTPPRPNIVLVGANVPMSITIQENSPGFCGLDGTIDSDRTGFTGTGFANTNTAAGVGINWKVRTSLAGAYQLTWRHSNGASSGLDRIAKLIVNGTPLVSSISFLSTVTWTNWADVSVNVNLAEGINDIRLEGITAGGVSNIDYLKVTGQSFKAESCASSPIAAAAEVENIEAEVSNVPSEAPSVYPNPSSNKFVIGEKNKFTYLIKDQAGTVLEQGSGMGEAVVGESLKTGIYLLQVQTPAGLKQIKMVKKD